MECCQMLADGQGPLCVCLCACVCLCVCVIQACAGRQAAGWACSIKVFFKKEEKVKILTETISFKADSWVVILEELWHLEENVLLLCQHTSLSPFYVASVHLCTIETLSFKLIITH